MAIFKCKMCGGELEITEETSVCECEYCGSKQTVSTIDDEKIVKLHDRANRLRMANEFDKAAGVYESIIAESDTDAEAYWGLLLCKYGIEYVDDPATGDKIPTCHRSSFDSIMEDNDFELVMENADTLSRSVYREQAKQIEEIRKGIIEVSGKEAPYDIFICYKETDENGDRTVDSVIAQDVYDALTDKGYRVFFSRITLEDKLGQEYEPYIFAALNSAKIMLSFGTNYDYYNAVWVKNEWSRYLKLMTKDKTKHLIPCYKDIDAYDMPSEFKHLQAQDMGKLGAMQDLLRGIDKILGIKKEKEIVNETNVNYAGKNVEALLKRGYLALSDREFAAADKFFEEVLNENAENAEAYVGKFLVEKQHTDIETLVDFYQEKTEKIPKQTTLTCEEDTEFIQNIVREYEIPGYLSSTEIRKRFEYDLTVVSAVEHRTQQKNNILKALGDNKYFSKARSYATGKTKESIEQFVLGLQELLDGRIAEAESSYESMKREKCEAYASFLAERKEKVIMMNESAKKRMAADYDEATQAIEDEKYQLAMDRLKLLGDYKDSKQLFLQAQDSKLSQENKERKERQEEENRKKERRKKIMIASASSVVAIIVVIAVLINLVIPQIHYNQAKKLLDKGDYDAAITKFEDLKGFKDSDEQILNAKSEKCVELIRTNHNEEAFALMDELGESELLQNEIQSYVDELCEKEEYDAAYTLLDKIGNQGAIDNSKYHRAQELLEAKQYEEAVEMLAEVELTSEMEAEIMEFADSLIQEGQYKEAYELLNAFKDKMDVSAKLEEVKPVYYEVVMKNAQPGDSVFFGKYEQDGNEENGPEDIEWIVLDVQDGKALVLSKYVLTSKEYATVSNMDKVTITLQDGDYFFDYVSQINYGSQVEGYVTTWEKSSLRNWLNGLFFDSCFEEKEKERIMVSKLKNEDTDVSYAGNDTEDKVFLLDMNDIGTYGLDKALRCAEPTEYAIINGIYCVGTTTNWWLRTPGSVPGAVSPQCSDGHIYCITTGSNEWKKGNHFLVCDIKGQIMGGKAASYECGVRPAMWISVQ